MRNAPRCAVDARRAGTLAGRRIPVSSIAGGFCDQIRSMTGNNISSDIMALRGALAKLAKAAERAQASELNCNKDRQEPARHEANKGERTCPNGCSRRSRECWC